MAVDLDMAHAGASALAGFLASSVEFVEALTVVLALGLVRGWAGTLAGAASALGALVVVVLVAGPLLAGIPLPPVRFVLGAMMVLFGLRWLRKAILREAGVLRLHDETALFADQTAQLRALGHRGGGIDAVAFGGAFQIVMIEGLEVVFIVLAIGSGGTGLLLATSCGALAALLLVILLGIVLHRPIANLPENRLKFAVGILLSAFGTFWTGEAIGVDWPAGDAALLALVLAYLAVAIGAISLVRRHPVTPAE
jgi:uncharacterized membrane protein